MQEQVDNQTSSINLTGRRMQDLQKVIRSLFSRKGQIETHKFGNEVREDRSNVLSDQYYPEIEETASQILSTLKDKQCLSKEDLHELDLFILLVQFTDVYDGKIILSDEIKDASAKYAAAIFNCHIDKATDLNAQCDIAFGINNQKDPHKAINLAEQWDIALKICNYDIERTLIVLVLTSRLYARGLDKKILFTDTDSSKDIHEDQLAWRKILGFFDEPGKEKLDSAGDTYYFWTACAGTYLLANKQTLLATTLAQKFRIGRPFMLLVRNYIVQLPTIGGHKKATQEGRMLGKTLLKRTNTKKAA